MACVDNSDCQELGIVDETACEFTPWAKDRCPLTCGNCKQDMDDDSNNAYSDDEDEDNEYDNSYDYYENDTRSGEEQNEECVDNEDCKELGIIDIDSCDFAPWAPERCPVTCNTC